MYSMEETESKVYLLQRRHELHKAIQWSCDPSSNYWYISYCSRVAKLAVKETTLSK